MYTSGYSTVNDLRVWELRLHLCQALKSTEYFFTKTFARLEQEGFTSEGVHEGMGHK